MSARHEYGLDERHSEPEKKFSIQKAPIDPDTLAIFEARRNAFAEPRRRMDRAKYMFAEIVDRAMNSRCPGFLRKGSVIIPDSELARKFGVWESTIYNWKRQLCLCGYIWIEKQYRSDRWPITVYHLACIHQRPNFNTQNPDGTSNVGGARSAPGKVGEPTGNLDEKGNPKVWSHGARKPGQKSLPLATPHVPPVPWNDRPTDPEKAKIRAIVAATTASDWLPATTCTGCEPQLNPADSHNGHRLTAGAERGPQPHQNGAESHNAAGLPATTERGHKRDSDRRLSHSESLGGETPPPDQELEAWKRKYRTAYEREIAPVKSELQAGMAAAAEEDKPWFKVRLDYLKSLRTGGTPPKKAATASRPVLKVIEAPVETLSPKEQEEADRIAQRLLKSRRAA